MIAEVPMGNPLALNPAPAVLRPRAEIGRLNLHFLAVISMLRADTPRGLSPVQWGARAAHVERLDGYRRRASFPKNRRFPGRRVPHFIDAEGTRCAMAHLLEATGAADLVRRIARGRNYARIRDLADLPELVEWLEANGLTLGEAARIQPSYCTTPAESCVCTGWSEGIGFVQATPTSDATHLTVTAVYTNAKGIAVGDVLPLASSVELPRTDGPIFAVAGQVGLVPRFGVVKGQVTVPSAACQGSASVTIPGPVPVDVLARALNADSEASCESVLAAHDGAWASKGECDRGCGCSLASGQSPFAAGALLTAVVVCAAHGARRASRGRFARGTTSSTATATPGNRASAIDSPVSRRRTVP